MKHNSYHFEGKMSFPMHLSLGNETCKDSQPYLLTLFWATSVTFDLTYCTSMLETTFNISYYI